MAHITIQCRLIASEQTRKALWLLASGKNTPLVNELIQQVSQHPDFKEWSEKGRFPASVVKDICTQLKKDSRFTGQPSRFFMSAEKVVAYTFKAWFKSQTRLHNKLIGKQKWLEVLKSDEELVNLCGMKFEKLQAQADKILKNIKNEPDQSLSLAQIRTQLFQKLESSKNTLQRCAISYLLKNGCKIPKKEEDLAQLTKRRRKSELQIKQLQDQLESRIPQGRDLTGQHWLATLKAAIEEVPGNNQQHKQWQSQLLSRPRTLPFPILFETNEDLTWFKNDKDRICLHFNGLSEHRFQIYCDRRQLHWFNRFLEDQATKRKGNKQHTSALFALRSARLGWQVKTGNPHDAPWNRHQLVLYCTVDTRLWSAEGTHEVRQENIVEVSQKLTRMNEKGTLSKNQQAYVTRLSSTLKRLDGDFQRPSHPRQPKLSHIIVGLSLGWDKPLTVAIWDANTRQVLRYVSLRQLLGKNYRLFTRLRQQQQVQSHKRHKAQKQGKQKQYGTSNLGKQIDCLLAQAVIKIANEYSASSIAIPKLENIRTVLQAEIEIRAEQKIPGYIEGQRRYAKQYKTNIHKWSFNRLTTQIASKAAQAGIVIEESKQSILGNQQEKAKQVAIAAYEARNFMAS